MYIISVIKSKRTESKLQFLDTAYQLYIFSMKQCVKFPKRYTFYISQEVSKTATEILKDVKSANSIFPTNAHEVQMRRDYFMRAYAETQALITQINAAKELFEIPSATMSSWVETIQLELSLLRGIMKNDKNRYKNILEQSE